MYNSCDCEKHVHEITGITKVFKECNTCHNHRFCTVSDIPIYTCDKKDHFHEVKFRTDSSDGHFHEFRGKSSGAIDVGHGKHVHFATAYTEECDNHKHKFQVASLIEAPTDFERK